MLIFFEKKMKSPLKRVIVAPKGLLMNVILDKLIDLLKWPTALYMLVSLPALASSIDYFSFANYQTFALGAGFFMYFVGRTMMDSGARTSMQIVAHELTHTFFALLTFHKIIHIRVDPEGSGGEMGFKGKGNWLIVIAPYFFPLFGLFYMLLMSWIGNGLIFNGILGYFLGYHTDTVASQIHDKQTDLPKVGYFFCLIFLPGANAFVIGSILAFNRMGWNGIARYFELINHLNVQNFYKLWSLAF
jgi:hypothetical protein